ncbi:MAG: hypothetical protein JW864_11705 [Spirochaetes bacterium]|nr:hypothetical protein [Spirochaetota bacterium]
MPSQIKTINDRASIDRVFAGFFTKGNVFLRTKSGDLKIQFLGYTEGIAAFKIPFVKNIPEKNILSTRHEQSTINALVKFHEKQEDNVFLFLINQLQVIYRSRGEERKSVDSSYGKDKIVVFITNLISYSIIQNSLSLDMKKIERIREAVAGEISQAFNFIKITFCNEGKGDVRMNYFFKNKEPISIPNIKDKEAGKTDPNFNFYINNIYSRDYQLQAKKNLVSEISVPLLYKTKLPYGYIQVNNSSPSTNSMLTIVKKFAALIDNLMNKEQVFPRFTDKLIVSNISRNGLGIVFRERKFIRYFKENNYIYFDLLLPNEKTAAILAIVRNITLMDNKIILIGCSIEEMDALSEVNYEEFLDSFEDKEKKPENE